MDGLMVWRGRMANGLEGVDGLMVWREWMV